MSGQNKTTEDLVEEFARRHGMSKRTVLRYAEFHDAVETLANLYGQDILHCLLDRDRSLRLTHAEIKKLAAAASRRPLYLRDLGDVIRAGDTGLVRYFLYGD
jgi:hypothetical protein